MDQYNIEKIKALGADETATVQIKLSTGYRSGLVCAYRKKGAPNSELEYWLLYDRPKYNDLGVVFDDYAQLEKFVMTGSANGRIILPVSEEDLRKNSPSR